MRLRALSSTYVERRGRLGDGAALSGAGKRAAFALFYGPLHYLLIREIVRALPDARRRSRRRRSSTSAAAPVSAAPRGPARSQRRRGSSASIVIRGRSAKRPGRTARSVSTGGRGRLTPPTPRCPNHRRSSSRRITMNELPDAGARGAARAVDCARGRCRRSHPDRRADGRIRRAVVGQVAREGRRGGRPRGRVARARRAAADRRQARSRGGTQSPRAEGRSLWISPR